MESGERIIREFVERYQQRVFALVLYLLGGDQDKAYDICADSFAKVLADTPFFFEQNEAFLVRLAAIAVDKARSLETISSFEIADVLEPAGTEKAALGVVARALQTLDFDEKAAILLRDQVNCSYRDIAKIMRISESSARHNVIQARGRLRDKIKEIISHG